ncbi:DUF1642 domain-containing protein [Streptococcus sp. IMAU11622]|uniref:DUF1642 domain-containing protein n=1 Tax=Streptococcus sp. IMAU11622 TaxID=3332597 RepID=UPI0039EE8B2E
MNKQELIDKFEKRKTIIGNFQGYAVWWEDVKEIFEQLDEPQPVKVPQFVADWIEESKKTCKTVAEFFSYKYQNIEITKYLLEKGRIDLVARAWLDGYDVEEEKKYFVKIKAVDQYLVSVKDEDFLGFLQSRLRSKFTRKELEDANLGWVFDCPGIEIEEVE